MSNTFLMPAARCETTGQVVKNMQLSNRRYTRSDRSEVDALSQILAEDLSARTRQTWSAAPITYTDN
jgi:hypothetical protein